MTLTEIKIKVPEQMVHYINSDKTERNAMIMYPYARNGLISYGRAAEIIGIRKWDLITLYNNLGSSYLHSISDYQEDLKAVEELKDRV